MRHESRASATKRHDEIGVFQAITRNTAAAQNQLGRLGFDERPVIHEGERTARTQAESHPVGQDCECSVSLRHYEEIVGRLTLRKQVGNTTYRFVPRSTPALRFEAHAGRSGS